MTCKPTRQQALTSRVLPVPYIPLPDLAVHVLTIRPASRVHVLRERNLSRGAHLRFPLRFYACGSEILLDASGLFLLEGTASFTMKHEMRLFMRHPAPEDVLTRTRVAVFGAVLGLVAPAIVLTFLWFGLGFDFLMGNINLTKLLWPMSRMILVDWDNTSLGIVTTFVAIAINCLLYAGIFLLLYVSVLKIRGALTRSTSTLS